MTKQEKIEQLKSYDVHGTNSAIQKNIARISAFTEEQFQLECERKAHAPIDLAKHRAVARMAHEIMTKVKV